MRSARWLATCAAVSFVFSLLQIPVAKANLYSFTSHTFTNCGATGRLGPSTSNCTSAYSIAAWASNTSFFNTSSGIQLWTVPRTATYRFTALGAAGGTGLINNLGGRGARVQVDIALSQGTQLKILVGQMGGTTVGNGGAGGGGGTFVTTTANSPLVVAGGGGGGGGDSAVGDKVGTNASITTSGTSGKDSTVAGGTAGNGGATPGGNWSGASGGGLLTNGGIGRSIATDMINSAGVAFTSGGTGGVRNTYYNYGSEGGFGGGGGASWGSGGGGGYSGGGADFSDGAGNSRQGGGGGGSFANGSNPIFTEAQNTSHGSLVIQVLIGAPDAPTIGTATATTPTTATVTFSAPSNNNGDTITAYTAISTPESRTATISQSGSGTITITGLSPNTSYVFRVYATNTFGDSALSAASNSITTPVATTSITISLTGNATTATYGTQITITATIVGTNGSVTFFLNSKRLPGCINRPTSSLSATCLWKPSVRGSASLSALFTPTSNAYFTSSTSRAIAIIPRTTRR